MDSKGEERRKRLRSAAMSRRGFMLILAAIFGLGLGARCLGLRLGLPYIHHWDECWIIWNARKMLVATADVQRTYQYGAPLSALLAGCVWLHNAWLWALPIAFDDEVTLRWMGRAISVALCSSGTVAMYLAGANLGLQSASKRRLGIYAASSYAFAYELVTHARYAVTDGVLCALAAWSLASGAVFLRTSRLRWAILSLGFATAAFGFKFTAMPTIAIPVLCLVVSRRPMSRHSCWSRRALVFCSLPAAAAGFFMLNPHFVDSWQQATSDLAQRMAQTRNGWFSHCYVHEPGMDHLSHVTRLLLGHTLSRSVPLACLFSAISMSGLAWAIKRRSRIVLIASIHALIVVVGLAVSARTLVLRNYLTAVPLLCLGVAIALEALSGWAHRRTRVSSLLAWPIRHLPEMLLVALALATLKDSVENQRLCEDSRARAANWVREHAASGSSVSLTPSVVDSLATSPGAAIRALFGPALRFVRQSKNCADLARNQPDYVVSASYRGPDTVAVDFDERWYFSECPGYGKVAQFDVNPYEATLSVYPTWMGRVKTIVLARHN